MHWVQEFKTIWNDTRQPTIPAFENAGFTPQGI